MISRFFKKKPKAPEPKKKAPVKAKAAPRMEKEKPSQFKKLLTAEGWKRMMMRKTKK